MNINGVRFNDYEVEVLREFVIKVKEAGLPSQFDIRSCNMVGVDSSAFESKLFEAKLNVRRTSSNFVIRVNPIVDAFEFEEATQANQAISATSQIEIIEEIGSGLYGKVYKARQADLDRIVAVKIIKPEWNHRADAIEHARKLAKVDKHPNIVTTYAVQLVTIDGVGRDLPAILMEWLEGEKIGVRLSGPRFSTQEVRRICGGVLDGVEEMHNHGIAHGDLHLGNVILRSDCTPVIIDIDASKERSLMKLSAVSREGAVSADIDYCRGLLQKVFAHGFALPSLVNQLDADLYSASTLDEMRRTLEPYLRGETPVRTTVAADTSTMLETRDLLIERVQRFIEDDKPASLHGLITNQTIAICSELRGERFAIQTDIEDGVIRQRIEDYEQLLVPLASALAVGCYWGDEQHQKLWSHCIEDVTNVYEEDEGWSGLKVLLELRLYPTLLLLYAAGMGAFLNDKFATLNVLLRKLDRYHLKRRGELADPAWLWKARSSELWNSTVLNKANRYTPVSDHLEDFTFGVLRGLVTLRLRFTTQFDRFEYFAGLVASYGDGKSLGQERCWGPIGSFLWRCKTPEDYPGKFFLQEAEANGATWPPFQAGLFNGSLDVLKKAMSAFDDHVNAVRNQLHAW